MATEYISREAAISEVLSEPTDAHYPSWYAEKLKQIPAADVVEVVRCKDCVCYITIGCSDGFGWCENPQVSKGVYDSFFCADGERRSNDVDKP